MLIELNVSISVRGNRSVGLEKMDDSEIRR